MEVRRGGRGEDGGEERGEGGRMEVHGGGRGRGRGKE